MAWRKNSLTENRSSNKIGNACNRVSNDYPEKLACCVEERLLERERERVEKKQFDPLGETMG